MITRLAKNDECHQIHKLHIESIEHYCSPFYSKNSIDAWVKIKKPEDYFQSKQCAVVVAEDKSEVVGFGLLNFYKNSIDSLYIKPHMSGNGIGSVIINRIEEIAYEKNITELALSSTLNAVQFYEHMGYQGRGKAVFKLSTGDELECVPMIKKINL